MFFHELEDIIIHTVQGAKNALMTLDLLEHLRESDDGSNAYLWIIVLWNPRPSVSLGLVGHGWALVGGLYHGIRGW